MNLYARYDRLAVVDYRDGTSKKARK